MDRAELEVTSRGQTLKFKAIHDDHIVNFGDNPTRDMVHLEDIVAELRRNKNISNLVIANLNITSSDLLLQFLRSIRAYPKRIQTLELHSIYFPYMDLQFNDSRENRNIKSCIDEIFSSLYLKNVIFNRMEASDDVFDYMLEMTAVNHTKDRMTLISNMHINKTLMATLELFVECAPAGSSLLLCDVKFDDDIEDHTVNNFSDIIELHSHIKVRYNRNTEKNNERIIAGIQSNRNVELLDMFGRN